VGNKNSRYFIAQWLSHAVATAASQGPVVVFHSPWHFEPVPTGVPVLMYTYLKTIKIKILRRKKVERIETVVSGERSEVCILWEA
jgi:hypothetical protein